MVKLVGLLLVFFLALLVSFPASCLAAESSAAPAAKAAPTAVIDPDMDEGHRQFAHANYEKALEHYLKALEKNKEDAYLYFRIGLTYYMLDDLDKSHDYWLKSYDYDPDLPDKYASKINSVGMYPTLMEGDIVTIDDQYYNYNEFMYGDVVNYVVPVKEGGMLSKRIIGLRGDTITICDGKIIFDITNKEKQQYLQNGSCINKKEVRIPENHVFVLGDNQGFSYDSRDYGAISIDNIFGKVLVIIQSFSIANEDEVEREERFGLVIN